MNLTPIFVFDFDGVIADSAPAYVDAINTVGAGLGASSLLDVHMLACMPEYRHDCSAELIGLEAGQLAQYSAGLQAYFHRQQQLPLFSEMGQVLRVLGREGTVVVLSANERSVIERALAELRVDVDSIHAGQGRDGKAVVLRRLANDARVLMVGDTLSDGQAAASAGVDCVSVSWGWQGRELLSTAPYPVVHNSESLLAFVLAWAAGRDLHLGSAQTGKQPV